MNYLKHTLTSDLLSLIQCNNFINESFNKVLSKPLASLGYFVVIHLSSVMLHWGQFELKSL